LNPAKQVKGRLAGARIQTETQWEKLLKDSAFTTELEESKPEIGERTILGRRRPLPGNSKLSRKAGEKNSS